MKAEGDSGEELHAGVESLDARIGELVPKGGVDHRAVGRDSASHGDKVGNAAAPRPGEPLVEKADAGGALEFEDLAQLLLEEVGAEEGTVGLLDLSERDSLVLGQVLGVLEDGVAGSLDGDCVAPQAASACLVPDASSDLVDGIGRPLHDVEGVHAHLGLGAALADDVLIGHAGVHADELDGSAPLGPEGVEEGIERNLVLAFVGEEEAARVVIDDDREVAMAATIADLIDPDALDAGKEIAVGSSLAGHALDDAADGPPDDPEQAPHGGLVGARREPRDGIFEVPRKLGTWSGPGDMLDPDPVLGAGHACPRSFDACGEEAKIERPPLAPPFTAIVTRTLPPANGASAAIDWSETDGQNETLLAFLDRLYDRTLDAKEPRP